MINQRVGDLLPVGSLRDEVEGFVRREVQKAGGPTDFKLAEVYVDNSAARQSA